MTNYSKAEQEIINMHNLFWQTYARRDLDLRFSLCSDDITFIGTGLHERATNKAEYRKINEKGLEQFPDVFQIEFLWTSLTVYEKVAWVECEVSWKQQINNIESKELLRNTTIFKNEMNKWKIVHVHGSVPDYRLNTGEFMTNEVTIKRNKELEKQVYERTQELNKSLENLKATQTQLIHSEKMASLGELTAGIAHEIQNPLNFVNNFSEVNTELIDELTNELDAGNKGEVISIANDIKENQQKINYHGKRADGIVKSMLHHSRSSTGQKELTDINALADEYLRLSYHGLRAKNKDFNSDMQTHFDEGIEKINIIPQDIGRALLNLFTNAFYAVNEKNKLHIEGYLPIVSVTTKVLNPPSGGLGVKIIVSDNGNGIPQKVLDKIFQPFFTTKPAGMGTGLGLSLTYDIIKAHNGEIKVVTNEGKGTDFIISLPIA